jgi:FixJ family two-component response regulator
VNESKGLVFVIDDEELVRRGLSRLLRAAGYRVETFASAREFLDRDTGMDVGCLVLDVQMPDLNGMELQEALTEAGRRLPIVFITGHGDIPTSVRAMKAGALDFLSKPFHEKDLLEAIDRGLESAQQLSAEKEVTDEVRTRLAALTPREHEVMLHVITGAPNKQIAASLGTTEKTIKVHRGRVMHKLEVESVADLVRLCEKVGIRVS